MLEQAGASVFALSTDDLAHAQEVVTRTGAAYPVLYGVNGPELAATWGAYYEQRRNILHATAFILRPDGVIASATYATGPVGRLSAEEAVRMVLFLRKQAAAK
jgi:peroxiredoxin